MWARRSSATSLACRGIMVEASPGADAAARAVADALARYTLTGLRLNSTFGFIVINVFPNPR